MQSCARGCLVQLGLWATLAAGFFLFLRPGSDLWTTAAVGSVVAGLLSSMALILLKGVLNSVRERRMLVRPPTEAPADGAWVALCGTARTRTPVRGPISGEPLALYEYKVQRWEKSGRTSALVVWCDGKAQNGVMVDAAFGGVRILSVPRLEVEPAYVESARAIANVQQYLRATTFEKRDTASERTSALEREWTDEDGAFRIDRRHFEGEPDLADGFKFEERQIRQGEIVCVFGCYSRERGGLIHDPRFARPMRIIAGSADSVASSLRGKMLRYTAGAIVLAGAAAAIVVLWGP